MKELLVGKLADAVIAMAGAAAKRGRAAIAVNRDDIEAALAHHVADVSTWCSEISFKDLRTPKEIDHAYIPLEVLVTPRRQLLAGEQPRKLRLEDMFHYDPRPVSELDMTDRKQSANEPLRPKHYVILGQPGAGKTTSMQHLCARVLFDDHFMADALRVPILVRLREFNRRRTSAHVAENEDRMLIPRIQEVIGLRIQFPADLQGSDSSSQRRAIRDRALIDALDSLRCLLVLDGFDEIVFKTHRESILEEIRLLAAQLQQSTMVVTSRTGEFNAHVDNAAHFEISPLARDQIVGFALAWLGQEQGNALLNDLETSPFADAAIRPLTMAHLCAIYDRVGKIPDKPKTLYRRIVNLLLTEWDEQRSIRRISEYGAFDTDRKMEFLAHLAYILTIQARGATFDRDMLISAYADIHGNFGLPPNDANRVVTELESHTGLFVQAGYEAYEFSHKSLQEFLAADYLVKLPSIPREARHIRRLPNELAVATAISSSASAYFTELVLDRLSRWDLHFEFYRAFVSRLLVEKPDFDATADVGIALLQLYSQYIKASLKADDQLYLLIYDQLADEFEQLASLIRDRVDINSLNAMYETVERIESADGTAVLRLVRRTDRSGRGSGRQPYPRELYARSTLLHVERKQQARR